MRHDERGATSVAQGDVDKIAAIIEDNDLAGDGADAEINDSLAQLLASQRGVRRGAVASC